MLLTGEKPVSSCDRKDNNIGLKPPKEYNTGIRDRVNHAIIHSAIAISRRLGGTKWNPTHDMRKTKII